MHKMENYIWLEGNNDIGITEADKGNTAFMNMEP